MFHVLYCLSFKWPWCLALLDYDGKCFKKVLAQEQSLRSYWYMQFFQNILKFPKVVISYRFRNRIYLSNIYGPFSVSEQKCCCFNKTVHSHDYASVGCMIMHRLHAQSAKGFLIIYVHNVNNSYKASGNELLHIQIINLNNCTYQCNYPRVGWGGLLTGNWLCMPLP